MIHGAFGRRLEGFALTPGEGKLSASKLRAVNDRIKVFKSWKVMEFDRSIDLLTYVKHYKTHVKRQFLYYYLHAVFEGIMDDSELEHVMLLQYAMLLLGTFQSKPVSQSNILLAKEVLNSYVVELTERKIPCRFVSHQIIHIPDDVAKYRCGVETLSAFQYESFLSFLANV